MLRTLPRLRYNGLTVILSNLSRFDKLKLLSANGGQLFNDHCLQPEFNQMQCDIRLSNDRSPFVEGTKCVTLLGEEAMHSWAPLTRGNVLNEMRGSPLTVNGIPAYASYFPQDCADIKDYEGRAKGLEEDEDHGDEDSSEGSDKVYGATKRSNYAFWLKADTNKVKKILGGYKIQQRSPIYRINPTAEEVIKVLSSVKGQYLDFDIETDYEEQNLLCFAFTFDGVTVYSVPVLDFNYRWAYTRLHHILRALSIAIRDNTLVAHNGAAFDFLVLAMKYHIPVRKCYDTMLAMHRCFPDVEKSLGHCVSYWTDEKFHKDTDSRAYRTEQHMMQKLQYCGKDVWTMRLVREAIMKYAKTIPGLESSIDCVMRSIRPYLTITMQGIRYSVEKVDKVKNENDRLMEQYYRIIKLLIGEHSLSECRKVIKSKNAGYFPGSNPQVCHYFHTLLGYPVMMRSKKTGLPSLGKKAMFQLALKFPENIVITFILLYRTVQKEYGSLKFNPWRSEDNKICSRNEVNNQQEEMFEV